MRDVSRSVGPRTDDADGRGDGHPLLRPETIRALSREHSDLILSLRALATLLREPETVSVEEAETILGRILQAELEQVSVLDGEVLTALQLETGELGAPREVDLAACLRAAARKSGRMTIVEAAGPVRVRGHPEVIEQEIASALALAQRIADDIVHACAERTARGGAVRIRVATAQDELNRARHDERIALLHRMVRAEGGRFLIERRDDENVTLHLSFYDKG